MPVVTACAHRSSFVELANDSDSLKVCAIGLCFIRGGFWGGSKGHPAWVCQARGTKTPPQVRVRNKPARLDSLHSATRTGRLHGHYPPSLAGVDRQLRPQLGYSIVCTTMYVGLKQYTVAAPSQAVVSSLGRNFGLRDTVWRSAADPAFRRSDPTNGLSVSSPPALLQHRRH